MASKQAKKSTQLQALHGWHGPEGVFEPGDLIPEVSADREKELIDGGYAAALTAEQAQEAADAAENDLPGQ